MKNKQMPQVQTASTPPEPYKVIVDCVYRATIEFTLDAASADEATKLAGHAAKTYCKVGERFPWETAHLDDLRPEFDASIGWDCVKANVTDVWPAKNYAEPVKSTDSGK
jgi:hypothetical protein